MREDLDEATSAKFLIDTTRNCFIILTQYINSLYGRKAAKELNSIAKSILVKVAEFEKDALVEGDATQANQNEIFDKVLQVIVE